MKSVSSKMSYIGVLHQFLKWKKAVEDKLILSHLSMAFKFHCIDSFCLIDLLNTCTASIACMDYSILNLVGTFMTSEMSAGSEQLGWMSYGKNVKPGRDRWSWCGHCLHRQDGHFPAAPNPPGIFIDWCAASLAFYMTNTVQSVFILSFMSWYLTQYFMY